jgi:sarcosine oxidase subunit alpha
MLPTRAQLVSSANYATPTKSHGYVTSAYFSANLNRSIALALVNRGRAMIGERLFVATVGASVPVQIVDPVFIDPKGRQLNG